MSSVPVSIRPVQETDADAIAAIYAHHVLHGTASYEIEPPSVGETIAKIRRVTGPSWPFIVAEEEGVVVGYAYATQFRDRAAYRYACEDSIYVAADKARRGIGTILLKALIDRSARFGFRTIVAVVGGAEPASIALHESCGFREVGRLKKVGFKFDRWLDSVYLQRDLSAAKF
ncbi:MAG TPA: GNAT family N-acetyltransferase [Sphingomicrobium sp.]|nr:GNAT family N-acetyltransferase [Sphingomicrobium sp.]